MKFIFFLENRLLAVAVPPHGQKLGAITLNHLFSFRISNSVVCFERLKQIGLVFSCFVKTPLAV